MPTVTIPDPPSEKPPDPLTKWEKASLYSLLGLTAPMWVPGIVANRVWHRVSGKPRDRMPKERFSEDLLWGLWPLSGPMTVIHKLKGKRDTPKAEPTGGPKTNENQQQRYLSVEQYQNDLH